MAALEDLKTTYAADIARIQRMANNTVTINEVEFAYFRLMHMPPTSITREYMLDVMIMTTGLVTAYGRLFTSATGTTVLDPKILPEDLRKVHEEIMELRHQRYAHHGGHPSVETDIELMQDQDGITLNQHLTIGMWMGAARHWQPLIIWLRTHMYEKLEKELAYLSKKSGATWKMYEGPAPDWAGAPYPPRT